MYLSSIELEQELKDMKTKLCLFEKEYHKLIKPIRFKIYRLKHQIKKIKEREDVLFNPQKKRRKITKYGLRKKDFPEFQDWVDKQNSEVKENES